MKKILIIGSSSDLAKTFIKISKKKKYLFYKIDKKKIFFKDNSSYLKLFKIIKKFNPEYIINFIGIFKNDNFSFNKYFDINTRLSWEIINYYRNRKNKKITLIFIGSSSFNKARKSYILYTASKAALNSIVRSAKELLKKTKVKIKIINPEAINTKMRKNLLYKFSIKRNKKNEKNPEVYAKKILEMIR